MPCVAITSVSVCVSQKANNLYFTLLYSARNSQISVPSNLEKKDGITLAMFYAVNDFKHFVTG